MKKLVLAVFAGVLIQPAWASPFNGEKTVYLVENNGTEHRAGTVTFERTGETSTYRIDWKEAAFAEHFLSMRPFKCMEGSVKHWCRVAYPYPIKREVSADDLTDLEYDTLFIWKGATEYGINMWNGVYYRLSIEGEQIVGRIHDMDMDTLSAPPEEGNLRPVEQDTLEPGEPESHWLPRLIIR